MNVSYKMKSKNCCVNPLGDQEESRKSMLNI